MPKELAPRRNWKTMAMEMVAGLLILSLAVYVIERVTPREAVTAITTAPPPTTAQVETPIPLLSPQQIASQCSERMMDVNSAHFRMDISGDVASIYVGEYPATLKMALRSVEGDFLRPDKAKASIEVSWGFLSAEVQAVVIGSDLQILNPLTRKWESVPPERGISPATMFDPERGLSGILKSVSGLSRLDDERIDGVPCYHLAGTISGEQIESLMMRGLAAEEVEFDAWVGAEDFLIRQMRMEGYKLEGEERTEWEVIVELSDFNKPVIIELPS